MSCKDWKLTSLADAVDLIGGGTPKTSVKEYWGGKIPWLSVKDFNGPNRYVYSTEKNITELGLRNSSTKLLSRGDIIISARGTVGEVAQLGKEMAFNQSCYGLRGKPGKITNDFLYYLLKYQLNDFLANTHGSVFDTITRETFNVIKAHLPSAPEQKVIAATLSCLDDKIELNNRINKTLEEMAQAIFKSWFVDFEPFQDGEFEESELGPIPKGWKIKALGEVCDLQKGLSYKGKYLSEKGHPMVNLGNVQPGGEFRYDKMKYYNGDYKDRHVVKAGDIIIANTDMTSDRAILGSPIFVPNFPDKDILFTHHLFAVKKVAISKTYLYYFFKSTAFRERAESYANGTTVLALSKDDLLNLKLTVPEDGILNSFHSIAGKIIHLKEQIIEENKRLGDIRDTLLPKLMSGEIRVPIEEV